MPVKDWQDWPSTATPILAAELKRMEQATSDAAAAASAATSTVASFSGRISGGEARITVVESSISDLRATKADVNHSHSIADITSLQTDLDGKAPMSHTHTASQVSGVVKSINGATPDASGALSIQTIIPSTSSGQILVGDGAGGWKVWDDSWTTITLPTGWVNVAGQPVLQARVEAGGVVRLRGAASNTSGWWGTAILLPPPFRPSGVRRVIVARFGANNSTPICLINIDGKLQVDELTQSASGQVFFDITYSL